MAERQGGGALSVTLEWAFVSMVTTWNTSCTFFKVTFGVFLHFLPGALWVTVRGRDVEARARREARRNGKLKRVPSLL